MEDESEFDVGTYVLRCVDPDGLTLSGYANFRFDYGTEVDLLALTTPDTLRAGAYSTAVCMCEDKGFELAQHIAAGKLEVVEKRQPSLPDPFPGRI